MITQIDDMIGRIRTALDENDQAEALRFGRELIGLEELDIDPRWLLNELLECYQEELSSCRHAEGKVRTVS